MKEDGDKRILIHFTISKLFAFSYFYYLGYHTIITSTLTHLEERYAFPGDPSKPSRPYRIIINNDTARHAWKNFRSIGVSFPRRFGNEKRDRFSPRWNLGVGV